VLADRKLLWWGLAQLLDNACKYSGAGTQITTSVQANDGAVTIRVWNNRASIPATEQVRIFDRFCRGIDAWRQAAGSGLGLYVARKIALTHGGNLDLQDSVIVVDDEPTLRKVLNITLTAHGFAVEEAGSAERALDVACQRRFDLISLDINLPGLDGIEACRRFRASSRMSESWWSQ
jgi:signal transduction histidine kinase